MDNLTYVFSQVARLAVYIWTRPVLVFGITTTYGAAFIWAGLAAIVIWFLRGLSE